MKWFKNIENTHFSIDIAGNVLNNNTNKIMRPYISRIRDINIQNSINNSDIKISRLNKIMI